MSEKLFTSFKKVSKEEWIEKASQDLKGTHPSDKFAWEIEPDLKVDPYYASEDLPTSTLPYQNRQLVLDHPSGDLRRWDNLQKIEVQDEKTANQQVLNALEHGADGIIFNAQKKALNYNTLLKGVQLPYCSIWFEVGEHNKSQISTLADYTNQHELNGGIIYSATNLYSANSKHFHSSKSASFHQCVSGDTHESFTEKIANLLHQTATLAEASISVDFGANSFFSNHSVTYTLGQDFFGEMASMRALRQLYYQVARAFEADNFKPEDLFIVAVSKAWTNEEYNPHANMLKGTTAGMAAILGGCNALLVEPEDSSNIMHCRIARNVSNILKEESYLNSQVDPIAGSYYIEALAQKMAEEAWKKFQQKQK